MPDGANIRVDGSPVAATPIPISGGYSVARVQLDGAKTAAHTLESDVPVGLQILGYGRCTRHQYPGGLNLGLIAPPPPPIK